MAFPWSCVAQQSAFYQDAKAKVERVVKKSHVQNPCSCPFWVMLLCWLLMRQVPPECDINIAVSGCSGFATSTQKGQFMAMFISCFKGTYLITPSVNQFKTEKEYVEMLRKVLQGRGPNGFEIWHQRTNCRLKNPNHRLGNINKINIMVNS